MESFMAIVTLCLFGILCYICSMLFGIKRLLEKVLTNQTPSVNLRDLIDYSMRDALETRKIHDQALEGLRRYTPPVSPESFPFKDQNTAAATLKRLQRVIEQYGFTTLMDLYDLIDIKSTLADNQKGWWDLSNVTLSRDEENLWRIDFPPLQNLDDFVKVDEVKTEKESNDHNS